MAVPALWGVQRVDPVCGDGGSRAGESLAVDAATWEIGKTYEGLSMMVPAKPEEGHSGELTTALRRLCVEPAVLFNVPHQRRDVVQTMKPHLRLLHLIGHRVEKRI